MASDDPECPICLGPFEECVETNCAHKYCGECILNCWETSNRHPLACQCPYCRRDVCVMIIEFCILIVIILITLL